MTSSPARRPIFADWARFDRRTLGLTVGISLALAIPCFWQPLVSPGDLQSHLYNGWLANLIYEGRAPGLYTIWQWTNILVDLSLAFLVKHFSVATAERMTTLSLALVFFWGAFRFVSVCREKTAWCLAPWLAILSYGFVFNAGFFNYYCSSGLVLWALSIIWNPSARGFFLCVPLLALATLAHPLPVIWFVTVVGYKWVAQRFPVKWQLALCGGAIIGVGVVGLVIRARYTYAATIKQAGYVFGADQAYIYGRQYLVVFAAMLALIVVLAIIQAKRWRTIDTLPLQLYLITAATIVLIPYAIGRAGAISQRLSLLACLLLLASLEWWRRPKGVLVAGLGAAAIFFGFLFEDVRAASRVTATIEKLVRGFPQGTRFVGPILTPPTFRVTYVHLIDRACIGHCFSFQNYEPATRQFRIRAEPDTTVVAADMHNVEGLEWGYYRVQAKDPPLYSVHTCGPAVTDLCVQRMNVGERGLDLVEKRRGL